MKKPTILHLLFLECFAFMSKNLSLLLRRQISEIQLFSNNKKRFLSNAIAMVGILLFMTQASYGQVGKTFSPRLPGGNMRIKGDVIFVGNSMMSRTVTQPTFSASDPNGTPTNLATLTAEANQNFNTAANNNGFNQEYTDIDSDPTTFASSSAELRINQSCKRIVYAGLYWTAIYPYERSTNPNSNTQGTPRRDDWNQIKFKVPGAANYIDIVADNNPDPAGDEDDIIYDDNAAPASSKMPNTPYACYKNVTGLLQSLADPNGNYFAANIRAAKGKKSSGSMAGWTLVVIYESPTLPSRYISTFDGFVGITSALRNIDFTVNGFRTLPAPLPVRATIGVATQEGESRLFGDDLLIKANSRPTFTYVNNNLNPLNNVFNSSITVPTTTAPFSANVNTRVPNSLNTLGFDMDLINVNNPNNGVIPNGETGATYRLTSTSDTYAAYLTTFAVDIIEPKIVLTKVVKNAAGVDIGNQNVTLGDYLNYEIGFKNVGNDDADQFTIKDVLPINILFDPNSIVIPNGSGITYTYTAATRTLIFTIPNDLVKINGNQWFIKFGVQVVPNCNDLSDACSDRIQNQAFATYRGITNPSVITDDPSISVFGSCNLAVAAPTNFLVGVDGCKYTKKYQLCGSSVAISAANGYNKYEWSTSPFVNGVATGPIIGNTQTITVTNVGTYYVRNTALAPCISIDETVTVEPFGTTVVNPVIPFASEVVTCPNNGKPLPNIYLCGANAKKYIRTGVTDTADIVWEKSSCVLVPNTLCADETNTCTWTQVATGPDYNVGDQGQYRITLRYANGCFNRYFFNVYENNLTPTATSRDIICTTNGEIVVGTPAAGTGYEYSLDGTNYQASNILPITTPNIYTVYIRSTANVANACVFTIPGIQIRKRDFTVTTTVNNPLCNGGKGSVKLAANDVRAQYFFEIFNASGVSVSKVGPITPNDYTFNNLNPGTYTVTVKTEDGCDYTGTVTLVEPGVLTATAAITKPLTCENGEITVTPVGGTGPFTYFVNSTTDFQGSPIIDVATPGVYNIRVVDFNNCEFTLAPITINATPKPVFTVTKTDVLCYGANSGAINFNVTNANGYTLAYSIDNGATYVANGAFTNLAPGTYTPILRYSLGGVDCFDPQPAVTITEPAAALTASAGVSELAGCGIAPNPKSYGKVRITNPQGGVAPYEYSFDNQATWTTVNDAYKAPGTYTLYVRDANGCIFSAPVTLDPEPAAPQIDVATPVDFNCDGTATSTVTVANPGGSTYTYDYYMDGVKNTNTPNNVFLNVPPGTHSIKVEYKLNAVPTFSNLLFENFGYGDDTTSPGMNATYYCFERQVVATQCRGSIQINDGDYSVTARIVSPFGPWLQPGDHTPPTVPPTPKGRCLVVNIGDKIPVTEILYEKVINNIIPNQPINVEFFAMNLLNKTNTQFNPDLRVALVDATGTEISWYNTGDIPKSEKWENYPKTPITLNPGSNTTLKFIVRSNVRQTSGNDVAIDDIKVFQLPKTCLSTKDFTIVVPTGKAFTAQISGTKNVTCNGLTNGEITISATNFDTTTGYQYSLDNGTTWSAALFTSPVTVNNLAGNLYKVIVRPVGSSVAACAKPFDVTISAPAALTLSASVTKSATCTTGATITAIGGGGTPAYQYELRQSNGTTVVTAYSNNGGVFTNVPSGNYTVFVRDANSCQIPVGVAVAVTAPPALTAALATTTDYCYTTANPATFDVTVTGGTGPFTYKLNSNAAVASAATSYSFTNVAPGTHTIVVTDSNNCTATISSIVIAPQIGFTVSLINDLTCLADATIGNPVVTGGNGTPYTYTVSHNGGAATAVTSFPYTATTHGTYVFTVNDSRGCPATSNTITVTQKTTPTITTSKTDITCNNANDGTITVTASGGFTSAYTYEIAGPVNISQTTNKFTGLAAGVYDVKVIDSKGCESAVTQVTIVNPPVVTASIAATDIGCSPTGTVPAVVTVTASGGTGILRYSFNGNPYTTSNTFSTTTAGPVNVLVRDANNCQIGPLTISITAPEQFTGITITDFGWDCRTSPAGGHVNIAASGVSAPKRYSIISGPAGFDPAENSDGEFKALAPGAYVFQVRDTKTNCTLTRAYTVKGTPDIVAGGNVTTPILCFGNLGAIQFTVSGLNGHRYDYVVTNTAGATVDSNNNQSAPTISLANLPASAYTIVVKDRTTDCTATYTINLTQPTAGLAIVSATPTKVFCSKYTSQVTVVATGGTLSYTYAYLPAGSTATPTYAPGNVLNINTNNGADLSWDIYVRDANGCTTKIVTPVTIPIDATPTISATANQCTATSNSFTITATGIGFAPLTYSLNGGAFQTSNTFTNLAPGSYTVTVKDGNGCTATTAPLNIASRLTLSAALDKDITCVVGDEPARITLTKVGGAGTFTYEFSTDNGVNWTTTTATAPFTTTSTGSYIFRVTDSNGCTVTTTIPVIVSAPTPVTATETHVDPTCNGFTDGSIRLTATAGVAPFTYAIAFSPTTPSSFGSANVFGGLASGIYNYIVRDAKGCEATGTIVLNNPPAIVANIVSNPIQCNSNAPGSIDASITSGGVGPFTYTLYNNTFTQIATTGPIAATTHNFGGLNFGDYFVIIVDSKGCEFKSAKTRILTPPNINATGLASSGTCLLGASVDINVLIGAAPFTYQIYGQPLTSVGPIAATTHTFTGLDHGVTYQFQVIDAGGCFTIVDVTTPTLSAIQVDPIATTNVTCNGGSDDGIVSFTIKNYNPTVTQLLVEVRDQLTNLPVVPPKNITFSGLTGSDVSGSLTGLKAGTYNLFVKEVDGTQCNTSELFQITQPAQPLTSAIASNVNATCNSGALVTLTTTGGTGPYTYAYALGATPPTGGHVAGNVITLDYNLGTSWTIQVRDANGCTVNVPVTIAKDPEPTIDPIAPVCFTGAPVTITVTGTSFGTPTYSINGGAYQASNVFTINAAGSYIFRIQDSNGCEIASPPYTIQPQLTLQANLTADLTCPNPASVTLVPAGGTNSYTTFEVDNGTGYGPAVNPFTTSIPGTYKFRVTDSQGCQAESQDVIVTPNTTPTFTTVVTNVTCDGGSDGTITITPANGIAPYTFTLTGPVINTTGDSTGVYSGLPVGSYTVVVTDAKGCPSTAAPAIPITAPAAVTVTPSLVPFGCNSSNAPTDAIVTLAPAGGTPGYTYSFDGGITWQSSPSYSVNTAQTISYMVSDSNGCKSAVGTIPVPAYTPPTDMDISQSIIYCNTPGLAATVTVNSVTGGVGPFVFEIISPTATTPSAPTAAPFDFNNLVADTYVIKVTDANGCSTTKAFVVEEADKISVTAQVINDVFCNGDSTGTIAFTVADYITANSYTETLSPALGTLTKVGDVFTYSNLPAGNYTFTITDNISGCVAQIIDFTVSQPAAVLDFNATATNINCNNDEATITVTATGGTPVYKYAVVPTTASAPAPSAYGLSNQLTVDTNSGANMVWDVYVMDANGCPLNKPQTIVLDANPSAISVAPFSECPDPINGTYTFTINTPTGVGPFEYSIGGGFQTNPTFVVNAPGSYDVTVKDANGCTTTVTGLVVIRQPLILTPTVTTPVSCANGDGVISVSTTGGSGNYEYRIDGGAWTTSTPFTNVSFGTRTIEVRDTVTTCIVGASVILQQATPVTGFALAKTEVTCNGGNDGTITATMATPAPGVNDNPVYTYTLSGTTTVGSLPVTRPAQASPLFSGLAAGTYTVVVTSERGCTATATITIIEPGLITVPAPAVVQFGCTSGNTGNLATLTVTGVTGGSGTYLNYEFIKNGTSVQFGNSNVYTEANLSGGSYVVNVYDDKGCMGTSTAAITIAPYIQLDKVNVNVTNAITCTNLEDIAVSVSAIGGTPANLQFTVRDVIYDNSVTPPTAIKGTAYSLTPVSVVAGVATFTDLPVGNYEITVRNLDTNCEIIGVHYVNEPNTFDLTIDNVVDVTCLNGTNGSARVTLIDRVPTPVDNAGPFTYTVTGPTPSSGTATSAAPISLTNLAAGTYTVTAVLTNTPYCTVSKNFTITGPNAALVISETHTEITCVAGNNDGSIAATATGGWPGGYEFQLENGATIVTPWSTVSNFNGLTAGTYTVKVRDPKGCEVFATIVLNNPTPIAFTATPSTTLLTCKGNTNATITVSVPTGGQGSNYLYTLNTTSATPMISSGPQSGNVFNNLGAGTYTVTVTDGWGCGTTSAPIVINEPNEVVASLVLATTPTCSTPATITLSATGGTGAYEYSTTATGVWSPMTGSSITLPVTTGTYRYYVRDTNGCISVISNDIKVEPVPTLLVDLDVVNAKINCKGDTSGVIVAKATGGLGNYVYTLLNGTGGALGFTPVQLTPGRFTQLPAGNYQVRVDSQDCNVISAIIVSIVEPADALIASSVATPVTCNGAGNGIITITASGGTGKIKYAIEPRMDQFFDTGVFNDLKPGTYQIIVQDENGCYVILTETITEPQPIFVSTVAGSEVQELCAGDNNAAFDITITGGIAPYSVSIDNINGTYVTGALAQTVFNFSGLSGGEHTVYIKDANGCTAEWIVTLDESVNLDPKATVAYGCDNNSPSNTVTVTLDASITNPADVDYALDGSTVFQASNIFSNVAPGFHTITARHTNGCEKTTIQFEVLGFTPLALTLSDGGLNEIVATATGGAGNYQYSFDGGNNFSTSNKLIYYKSGDYTVIVRDANGCEATATRYFEFIDIKIPDVFTPNGDGNNDTWTPTNTINYKDLTISIFDRYGRKVATLREGQGWDGKYNSLELPTGDYWYVLKLKNVQDDREFVGHFTLMR